MRTRRLRYWLIFFLAAFALHGVASAIGLCAQDLLGPRHDAVQVLAAVDSACPDSDRSAPCPKHYAQSSKTSVEKVLVSTATGSVRPALPATEAASTGGTNEPSDVVWSLMTP